MSASAAQQHSSPKLQVRLLAEEDSSNIARIHREVFSDTPSSRLGHGYCRRLYSLYATENDAFGHVLLQDGETVGFVVGGTTSTHETISSKLRKQAALASIFRPDLLFSVARTGLAKTFRSRTRSKKPVTAKGAPDQRKVGKLFLIGVLKKGRGTGGARHLLDSWVDHAFSVGFDTVVLNVLRTNLRARSAYEKAGWVLDDRGGESVEYFKVKPE